MREIKFRAWDKKRNKMTSIFSIKHLLNHYCDEWDYHTIAGNDLSKLEDYEIMQYTGMKDKNGKEIYEGDILKETVKDIPEYYKGKPKEKRWYGTEQYIVLWNEELHYDSEYSDCDIFGGWNICMKRPYNVGVTHEIIGNKFENPELIGG